MAALQFAPFGSEIELPFYTALSTSKIDVDKLDDSARKVLGLYEPRSNLAPESSCRMQVLGNALTSTQYAISLQGRFKLTESTGFLLAAFVQKVLSRMSTLLRILRVWTRQQCFKQQLSRFVYPRHFGDIR